MKLKDAIFDMKKGDKAVFSLSKNINPLFCNGENSFSWIWMYGARFNLFEYIANADADVVIIRAEPKVLTATEIWDKVRKEAGDYDGYHSDDIDNAIKISHQNGKLEEWKRLKPLIDAAKELTGQKPFLEGEDPKNKLFVEVKNLKPPYEDENN